MIMFPNIKTDTRPKKNGWCNGRYHCECSTCGSQFLGDKRAVTCANCAYGDERTHGELYAEAFNLKTKDLKDQEECSPGCRHHVTHRCEKCARYAACGTATIFVPKSS